MSTKLKGWLCRTCDTGAGAGIGVRSALEKQGNVSPGRILTRLIRAETSFQTTKVRCVIRQHQTDKRRTAECVRGLNSYKEYSGVANIWVNR